MMTMMTKMASMMMMAISTACGNPMKMSMWMTISSILVFWNLQEKGGKSWMPMNMFMLFMGGIMIMFMILSSSMPNEKMKKLNNKKYLYALITATSMIVMSKESSYTNTESQSEELKWFINNSNNMAMTMTIMTIYFSMFINLSKKMKSSKKNKMK